MRRLRVTARRRVPAGLGQKRRIDQRADSSDMPVRERLGEHVGRRSERRRGARD